MQKESRIVIPGPNGVLIGEKGERLTPPKEWDFLPAGDAGVTRKVTAKGNFWRVQVKKGRRTISKGVWAPAITIEWAEKEVAETRTTDAYKKKREYDRNRRQKQQQVYEIEFCKQVEQFLAFHPQNKEAETMIAKAVTTHAIPVGSGTVARTSMIPVEERASRAVIAWMRHKTTAYDNMKIARIKGERRAVRRMLAQRSIAILENYRNGKAIALNCPLKMALKKLQE